MELLYYVRVLGRRWMVLATAVLLALIVAALTTARMSPRYAASITLAVAAPDDGNAAAAYQAVLSARERAKSYAKLIRSRSFTAEVARALGNGVTAEDVQRRVSAQAVPDTVLLRATVTDGSPVRAMQLAHTLGVRFARYVNGLERPAAAKAGTDARITIADDAELPAAPVSPRPLLNLALGLIAGLIAGTVAAVLREVTDTSVRSVPSLREAAGGEVLGVIGVDRRLTGRSLVIRGDSPQVEAFRLLRTNLNFSGGELPRSVVVTSPLPEEGKSTVACNLAVSLAECGLRVVLADADLRGSRLADALKVDNSAGLSDVLFNGHAVGDVLQHWGPGSLSVLPSGAISRNPSALLTSPKMASVLRELEERADIVLFDAPAVLSATDAAILARSCTGALLVARYGRTRCEQVAEAVERLETVHANVLGTVLGLVPTARRRLDGPELLRLPEPAGRRRLVLPR
jgi:capsular exopolysaccharide synthesis family protein